MKLRKYLTIPLVLAAISTQFSCGKESLSRESTLTATAQEASALKAIQDVLNGADINTVLRQTTLSADHQAIVWDFYKAQTRVGVERRKWVRAGQIHGAALLEGAKGTADGKAIQKSIQALYLKSFKEENSLNYQASVYSYVNLPDAELNKISAVLLNVPASQRDFVAPIFVVKKFPGGRTTGGAYYPPEEVKIWLGKSSATGVPDQDIQDFALSSGHGIVAISETALLKEDLHPYTILHEVAHSIDHFIKIVPAGATITQFHGLIYPKERAAEYATEAYARYMINKKRVCRDEKLKELGETQAVCSKRIIDELNKAKAFQSIPLSY